MRKFFLYTTLMQNEMMHGLSSIQWRALGADTWSVWFGTGKLRTADCDRCPFLHLIDGREWCLFGVGKVLEEIANPKKCCLLKK